MTTMLSNGTEAKVGTLGSKYAFFHEWKRLKEDEEGSVALETMLRGICNKRNLMDLFENFILFDHSGGHTAKILARNHQYLGVNEAVEVYRQRKLRDGKLGVFWHTQGSGKSYSKASSVVVSLLFMFAILFLASYCGNALSAEPQTYSYVAVTVDGVQFGDLIDNPQYIGGFKRTVYEFIYDFLPTGQSIQLNNMEFENAARWPWLSVIMLLISTFAGYIPFYDLTIHSGNLASDLYNPILPVDVAPLQPKKLTPTQAGCQLDIVHFIYSGGSGFSEECLLLRWEQSILKIIQAHLELWS